MNAQRLQRVRKHSEKKSARNNFHLSSFIFLRKILQRKNQINKNEEVNLFEGL